MAARAALIVSCGEALVDFVPGEAEGRRVWLELLGGSPFNVARGLGRLGVAAGFAGAISTDAFGDELAGALEAAGVSLAYLERLERPSTLSFVHLGGDGASYSFYSAESADRHYVPRDPTAILESAAALHFGSNSLVLEPAASVYAALLEAAAGRCVVSIDPNVRPRLVEDRDAYLERLGTLLRLSDLVKLSGEDLAWLWPGRAVASVASELLHAGPALVVVTHGGAGAVAYGRRAEVAVAAGEVEVLDTIGAGDGFTAGLLAGLSERQLLSRAALEVLSGDELAAALALAAQVSATVCARRGAEMPSRDELLERR